MDSPGVDPMKLFLDDERPTPDGWERAYTAPEAIALLKTCLWITTSGRKKLARAMMFVNGLNSKFLSGLLTLKIRSFSLK
jgi:hypothetical protein